MARRKKWEVFYSLEGNGAGAFLVIPEGWYWWQLGPDGRPLRALHGPFDSEEAAKRSAQRNEEG